MEKDSYVVIEHDQQYDYGQGNADGDYNPYDPNSYDQNYVK